MLARLRFNKAHHATTQFIRVIAVVRQFQPGQHIRPAHHPQADATVLQGLLFNLLKRVSVLVDDVIQKMHGRPHHSAQTVEVDALVWFRAGEIVR